MFYTSTTVIKKHVISFVGEIFGTLNINDSFMVSHSLWFHRYAFMKFDGVKHKKRVFSQSVSCISDWSKF